MYAPPFTIISRIVNMIAEFKVRDKIRDKVRDIFQQRGTKITSHWEIIDIKD